MIYRSSPNSYTTVLPGVEVKTLTHGDSTLMCEFRMKAGSKLPAHAHIYEQTGYLVEGKILLTIEGDTFSINAGDSWCIKGNMTHSAEIVSNAVAIEVFSPVRDDYLAFK